MNPLPWLLDWPPSRATVVAFLVLTAFSLGTLVVFGGVTDQIADGNVTVESDLSVRLNDDLSIPDTNGSVESCLSSGVPGDSVAVLGDVTVDVPAGGTRNHSTGQPLTVAVSLPDVGTTTTETVEGTGGTADVFWVSEDDETLAVGEKATVEVQVRSGDSSVATLTRSLTVRNGSRSYDC